MTDPFKRPTTKQQDVPKPGSAAGASLDPGTKKVLALVASLGVLAVAALVAAPRINFGDSGAGTANLAGDLSRAVAWTSHCYDKPNGTECYMATRGDSSAMALCLAVTSRGVLLNETEEQRYKGADWKRFQSVCDDYEVAYAMPRFLAEPEFIRIAQNARKAAD